MTCSPNPAPAHERLRRGQHNRDRHHYRSAVSSAPLKEAFGWSRAQLERMNARFCQAMIKAIVVGKENPKGGRQ
jgi:hypothetical protein